MRTNFALSLSFSGIQFLQRQENGWGRVGDVDTDSTDLFSDLTALRVKAEALGSGPVETKLIIPDDQIKYLTIDATALDKDALQNAVLTALDDAAPYPMDEFKFDFANETGRVHVAAVAKKILQEAEAFASEHGFAPMGFVAAPSVENLPKEASFDVSALGKSKGVTHIESDGTRAITTGEAIAIIKEPVVEELSKEPEVSIPVPGFSSRRAQPVPASEAKPTATSLPVTQPPLVPAPSLGGAHRSPAPALPPLSATPDDLAKNSGIIGVSKIALKERDVETSFEALRPGEAFDDDVPPMPTADRTPIADLRAPVAPAPQAFEEPKRNGAATAAPAEPTVNTAKEDKKQRMTIFCARKPKKTKPEPIPVGGKPRFIGLIFTEILLLFLVSVAAWASVFLDEGLARFFGGGDRNKAIVELSLEDTAASQEYILLNDAQLDQGVLTQIEPAPRIISPEETAAKYAETGILFATPTQPLSPPKISLEDVYLASIENRINGQDAFALEPLSSSRDTLPNGISGYPVAAENQFVFDNNRIVPATPEDVLVFLGRPERVREARLKPSDVEQTDIPENTITTSLRPKMRPATLVEDTERTQLGSNPRVELGKIRPKLRPKLAKKITENKAAETSATKFAVAASRKPAQRPRNFSRIVARAKQQAEAQPQKTQVAAVTARTVKPRIPSSASVAKTATVRNAINLSRVNLIGVYGKPSNRRALVRLSSGRYKKVKVGDRVDGGQVSAIGEAQLIYTKRGRNVTLRMP